MIIQRSKSNNNVVTGMVAVLELCTFLLKVVLSWTLEFPIFLHRNIALSSLIKEWLLSATMERMSIKYSGMLVQEHWLTTRLSFLYIVQISV